MQRPVMNPLFHEDTTAAPQPKVGLGRRALSLVLRLLRCLVRLMLYRPFARRRDEALLRIEGVGIVQRFVRGLIYRLAAVPVLVVLLVGALVYTGTHPPQVKTVTDPAMQGIYYDPITFLSADGTRLEAWLVPLFDARKINEEREKALRQKQPAVVLVHDYGSSRAQLLPLVRPLHESGMVVLSIGLRGCGASSPAANTFGLNESHDVIAAVEMLRRRQFIDGSRIAVLGVGTGATAALLAAERDAQIAALVLEDPVKDPDQVIARRIGPKQPWLRWMHPLCKWTFEMAYRVNAEELRVERFAPMMKQRPVYMIDGDDASPACVRPPSVKQIQYFLAKHLTDPKAKVAATTE